MNPLAIIIGIFALKGFLSGYKTYIIAAAAVMAFTASFLTDHVIPLVDGTESINLFFGTSLPGYIKEVIIPLMGGTLRHAMETSK